MTRLARNLLLAAIRGYKRHVSPHKGFSCAYRVHEGCASCSTLGLRAISRYGAWRGLGVLRLRLEQCHLVAEEHRGRPRPPALAQAGFVDCDVPCDGSCVDASSCDTCEACEIASWLNCDGLDDCDYWPGARRSTTAPVRRRRRRGEPPADAPGSNPPAVPGDDPPVAE